MKKEKQIRILHITGGMNMGGIENFIMNIYRNIDRTKIQFDFLIHQDEKQVFEDEILSLGGKVYRIPSFGKLGHFGYLKILHNFFLEHSQYKIVHSHYNAVSGIILREAKRCSIKNRIAHSHTAYPKYRFIESIYKNYSKYLIKLNATRRFACSKEAGNWLYGKNKRFEIINNGIEIEKYIFDENIRNNKRKEMNILENEFCLISVGRLSKEKNFEFLLDIMKIIQEKSNKIKLCIAGEGEEDKFLKSKIKNENIKNIEFLGVRKDIKEIYNAMDLMVFPSLFEGLGIVAIEAQCNGLKVLVSENIPKEADLGLGFFKVLNLDNKTSWINEIIKESKTYRNRKNKEKIDEILESDYNAIKIAKKLEDIYLKMRKDDE